MGKKSHKGKKAKRLCKLIDGGYGVHRVMPLVVDPRFICGECGRAAHKKKHFCSPKELAAAPAAGENVAAPIANEKESSP